MKVIHTADLHLGSKLKTNLDSAKARARRRELVLAFENVVKYAAQNSVELIIIAGDMFDTQNTPLSTVKTVADIICSVPQITFLLLLGNHDKKSPFSQLKQTPQNLKIFSDSWSYFDFENVTVAGVTLEEHNKNVIYSSLSLSPQRYNIAVMHGDIESEISLSSLKGKNIDYLALGHIHKHSEGSIDARGRYAYSGCLESRGFDESGKKGFYLLDTDKNSLEFVEGLTLRNMYEIEVDISELFGYLDIKNAVQAELFKSSVRDCDMVKLVLKGSYTIDTNKDIPQLKTYLENSFYFAKVEDDSTIAIDAQSYKNDVSLKGEFVRKTLQSDLSEEQKQEIILLGIRALRGEEL